MKASEIQPATTPARSPKYPCIDIGTAIEKAKLIFRETGRHPTDFEVIARCWGSKPTSGTFRITLAALRAFGLLESVTSGAHRLEKLSALALDIVADYAHGSGGWQAAVRTAALKPPIYASLWERYSTDLPADDELRRYLIRERGFTDRGAGEFLNQCRVTLGFAHLSKAGKQPDGAIVGEDGDVHPPASGRGAGAPTASQPVVPPSGPCQATLPLGEGLCLLQWPPNMSAGDFSYFEAWLQVVTRVVKSSIHV
jgi:hypothetical protein